ncbi:MAG TPA: DEAD/DEAH box helicase [Acidimicrobiales bacterium]|nr:DEAD/DEAH box helicase [Acidimicrobiales bacterium]
MSTTFAALGVSSDLVDSLATRGITAPFPVQAMTIPDGLAGLDVCGKAKTGSGKTLAFGLPIVERVEEAEPRHPRAIVLVPTRELAVQVTLELEPLAAQRDRIVQAVYGGTDMDKQLKSLEEPIDIVVATPGRLIDLIDRKEIFLDAIEQVVLDEADRMADMGFLPQVEWVLRHVNPDHQTMLFSATLDGEVDHLVRVHMKDPVFHEVASDNVTVEDMTHRFLQVHQMDKVKVAAAIAAGTYRCRMFVRTKRGADRLAEQLEKEGVRAEPIHGDLRQGARERALNDFMSGELHVLVATDVAARGIHVDEIDVVVHYDPPADHKTYLHRSGRTARAGSAGVVATLVLWDQELEVKAMQKRIGLDLPLVEVFSNDPRLADLAAWDDSEAVA